MRLSPFLVLVVAAGCLSPEATPGTTIDLSDTDGAATRLVCPPGGDIERVPGVCVGTLARAGQALTEPKLSIDPNDPDRLALGVNAGNTLVLDEDALLPIDPSPYRSEVFVSEDGGASWRHARPPVPLAERGRYASADTDAMFDRDGTLHVTALSVVAAPEDTFQLHLFHTASQDDGRTWSNPTLFHDDGLDNRNWNTVAPDNTFVVAWSRPDASEIAWSADDGATWDRMTIDGCTGARPVVYHGDVPLFACRGEGVEVHRLDLANATHTLVSQVLEGYPLAFTRGGDGGLWVGAWDDGDYVVARSADGGASWDRTVRLAEIDGFPEPPAALRWIEADPWGNAHLLVEALRGPCRDPLPHEVRGACPSETVFGGAVLHLVLDATGAAVSLERLTPEEMRTPPVVAAGSWDDYHTIAFAEDHGMLVWTYDKGLDFTRVESAWSSREWSAEANR